MMESDILDILEQVGYDGPLAEEACLLEACGRGFSSSEYVSLVTWLSSRLTHTQEPLITDPDRCMLDTGRLLKDLCCPYKGLAARLADGDVKDTEERLKIVLFLASELQAEQMVSSKPPADAEELDASLQDLRVICEALKLPDPAGRDARDAFTAVEQQVKVLLKQLPEAHVGDPAFKSSLRPDQWGELEKISGVLSAEYECRRRMLIKRLDVTVQSFSWSDRAKVKIDRMARAYQSKRYSLSLRSAVSAAHLLAARQDLCYMVKTSSGSCREKTSCAINRILMGRVPDRGGRPSEIVAPPPEMPAWQKRSDGGGGHGGNRGAGGWRGGRRAGRWSRGGRGGQYYH
ncbi:protein FAM98B isoform X2 [Onychostoma macrolepis]|uniref:protein FAM98B isoform X2 n=1 Tax=Onychostoma macrolepis TaxID=369639 RepID=UPI00272AD3C2|nr:protein FAM98B isoform X2 [Onychostoma macrolepis]